MQQDWIASGQYQKPQRACGTEKFDKYSYDFARKTEFNRQWHLPSPVWLPLMLFQMLHLRLKLKKECQG